MTSSINTDQPKTLQEQDCFQRYEFSRRVAKIISANTAQKSLVIGLFGKWGEGKTSVMNFIKAELPEDTVIVNFNPWLFSDQEHLIKAFFDSLAAGMGQSITTKKENIGKILSDYGSMIGNVTKLVGVNLDGLKAIGDQLENTPIEVLKDRVDRVIQESGKKIVVCVDDIDRLDVREIQYIFKLIKLVGDFCNTAYILAFDDEMVAGALAPLYGSGEKANGYQFLEKIIQVPLKIPKATRAALRNYTIAMIDQTFKQLELQVTMEEVTRFRIAFDENFIPVVDNPRTAIRYANSLFFALPLLLGEVCTTDLMLVEGIKVFFPAAYDFMRVHAAFFITDNMQERSYVLKSPGKGEITAEIARFMTIYPESEQKVIKEIWMELFPQYAYICRNTAYPEDSWRTWYREKRICSGKYFERYFTYAVNEGDISDVFFNQFLKELEHITLDEALERVKVLFEKISLGDAIFKLRLWEDQLSEGQSIKLSEVLAAIGPDLPVEEGEFRSYTTRAEGAKTIARLMENLPIEKRGAQTEKLFSITASLGFAMDICYWVFYKDQKGDERFYTTSDEKSIKADLLGRFKNAAKYLDFFEIVEDMDLWRLMIWWHAVNPRELKSRIIKELKKSPSRAIRLIKVFTPTVASFGSHDGNQIYKAGFNEGKYDAMAGLFDPSSIYRILKEKGNIQRINLALDRQGDHDRQSDNDLANIFMQIYEKKHMTLQDLD